MCPESDYQHFLAKQQAEGGKELIITVPDEQDESVKRYLRDMAAHTTGRMRVTETTSDDIEIFSMDFNQQTKNWRKSTFKQEDCDQTIDTNYDAQ